MKLAVTAVVALLMATHVFVAVPLARVKVVEAPLASANGEVRAVLAGSSAQELPPPFALIGRIDNRGETASFTVSIDGTAVCTTTIDKGRSSRFDCSPMRAWSDAAEHVITIAGPSPSWRLEYLELATHHGGTSGSHNFLILPGSSSRYAPVPLFWALLSAAVVFAVALVPPPSWPVWGWRTHRAAAAIILAFFALVLASEHVSAYKIVLSLWSASCWTAAILLPSLWRIGGAAFRATEQTAPRPHAVLRSMIAAAIVLLAFHALVSARLAQAYHGNYSGFLFVSQRAFDENPLLQSRRDVRDSLVLNAGGGYDAQFMYFAAFDPFLRVFRRTPERYRAVVDAPPYRYGRIGYVLLTIAASGGRWERYPATMIWLILGSLACAAFAVAMMAQARGMSAATGLLVAAVPGFWQSLTYGLPEPIAAATLLAGIACVWRERWLAAAICIAVSLLVRETGIVAIAAVLAVPLLRRRPGAIGAALFAGGVVVAWRVYVTWALFADWGVRGLLYQPGDLTWPGGGFVDLWRTITGGQYYVHAPELARAGIAYPLLLTGGCALACALAARRRDPIHIAAAVYGLLAISLNYEAIWIHVGNGVRGTYELFLMLIVATLAWRSCSTPIRAGLAAFWIGAVVYIALFGQDADAIRAALALPLPI